MQKRGEQKAIFRRRAGTFVTGARWRERFNSISHPGQDIRITKID
jgi:hypothetical protein